MVYLLGIVFFFLRNVWSLTDKEGTENTVFFNEKGEILK
jgi:hypothetical protein